MIITRTGGDTEAINRRDYSSMDTKVSYEGAVLELFERNGYHDSDFFALVYDEDEDRVKAVQYATTRGWTYANSASIDATDEVLAKATAASIREARRIIQSQEQLKAETVAVGKTVQLVSDFNGRKQPSAKAGEEAQVRGVYEDNYRVGWEGRKLYKATVDFADGRSISLATDRFEVVDPDQYLPSSEEMDAQAERWVKHTNFRSIYEGWLR
jgi:hypothetical protein